MSWLLVVDDAAPAAWNMAADAALLEEAAASGLACLRLYAWNPPALSFGRHEPAMRRYDRGAIEARGLAVTRRPTGGRAVWHAAEVTYAVTAPEALFGALPAAYREIHAMLCDALRSLGAAVTLVAAHRPGGSPGVGAGACFATAAGGEVAATDARGGKVVGSAQVRGGGALLQHGSILLEARQDVVAAVTRGAAAPPDARGVADLVPAERATWRAVAGAVAGSAAGRWDVPRDPGALPDRVIARARQLAARYADPAWIWRR